MYYSLFPFTFWFVSVCVCSLGSIFPSCKPSETIFKITFWLGYLNSCINPIIYPCFSREFKKAFHNVLRGRCLRTGALAAKPQGHIPTHSSPGPPSNTSVLSAKNQVRVSSAGCCGALSTSSSSVCGPDRTHSAQIQSKSLLKAWCLSASRTPVPQNPSSHRSTKVLRISLGVTGDAVWLACWCDGGILSIRSYFCLPCGNTYVQLLHVYLYSLEASQCRASR